MRDSDVQQTSGILRSHKQAPDHTVRNTNVTVAVTMISLFKLWAPKGLPTQPYNMDHISFTDVAVAAKKKWAAQWVQNVTNLSKLRIVFSHVIQIVTFSFLVGVTSVALREFQLAITFA